MKRLLLAVLTGFLVSALLSTAVDFAFHSAGIFPPIGTSNMDNGLLAVAFGYRMVFNFIGLYLTAVIAKEQAWKAVLVLGIAGSFLWLIGGIAMWKYATAWYNIGGAIPGLPLALLAFNVYERRTKRAES